MLILGDTNSSLAAIAAKRRRIPVFHMEAGNRRFFDVRIAGVAALLVSKTIKVADRLDDPRRDQHIAKDALDMLHLLRSPEVTGAGILRNARDSKPSRSCVRSSRRTGRGGAHSPVVQRLVGTIRV